MTEPSEDFDWDELEHREHARTAQSITSEQERAAVERGARAFAQLTIYATGRNVSTRTLKTITARVMLGGYLLRLPGFERFLSIAQIARECGVHQQSLNRMVPSVRAKLGLPPELSKAYKRKA